MGLVHLLNYSFTIKIKIKCSYVVGKLSTKYMDPIEFHMEFGGKFVIFCEIFAWDQTLWTPICDECIEYLPTFFH